MVLLIDNFDSFTYNLYQQIRETGTDVVVQNHDNVDIEKISAGVYKAIVISPGPGRPEDAGQCLEIISRFSQQVPILGICLGHQCLAQALGYEIILADQVVHGKIQEINHTQNGVFRGLPNPIKATRYHSLVAKDKDQDVLLQDNTSRGTSAIDARSDTGEIMAISHKVRPLYGIQFHPESYGTELGHLLIKNFMEISNEFTQTNY